MRAISSAAVRLRDPHGSGFSFGQLGSTAAFTHRLRRRPTPFCRSLVVLVCAFYLANTAPSMAQGRNSDRKFPYDAIVETDGTYVRSGAHETKYYPTSRLAKGQKVRVYRHDPGGWFMIAPPEGSFSWIPKRYVNVTGEGVGEVVEDGVVVYVGTEFGREATVWQRRMRVGDRVEILGSERIEVSRDRGPEEMLKIKPPRREYRYIPGHAVIAADEAARMALDREPVGSNPSGIPDPRSSRSGGFLGARPTSRLATRPRSNPSARPGSLTRSGPTQPRIDQSQWNRERARLRQLDSQFRAIIERPKAQWDFAKLETDYLVLKRDAGHPALASQVDLRLPAIRRYQKKKRMYEDFVSLTSATTKRDQELARMSSGMNVLIPETHDVEPSRLEDQSTPDFQPPPAGTPNGPQLPSTSAPTLRFPDPQLPSQMTDQPADDPAQGGSVRIPGQPTPPATGAPQQPIVEQGRPGQAPPGMTRVPQRHAVFCGAGIIQRSTQPNVPKFVLLTPKGSILAYLDAVPGVDLSKQVNFAMGIVGERFHSQKLQADYIKVRGTQPINLR